MKNIDIVRRAENRIKDIDYKLSSLEHERKLLSMIIEYCETDGAVEFLVGEYKQLYQRKQPWN